MKFMFDLDDTLVFGDIIADVSSKMVREGLTDRIYSNQDIANYDLRDIPENVRERVKRAFTDPDYVWLKRPIVGVYYFLKYLDTKGHELGIITARPITTFRETMRFISTRFHDIKFSLGKHIINSHNQINMKNIPTKKDKLEKIMPDFYFDDNADYCMEAHNLGIETFLVSNKQTPWNHEFARHLKLTNHPITVLRNIAFFPETRL